MDEYPLRRHAANRPHQLLDFRNHAVGQHDDFNGNDGRACAALLQGQHPHSGLVMDAPKPLQGEHLCREGNDAAACACLKVTHNALLLSDCLNRLSWSGHR